MARGVIAVDARHAASTICGHLVQRRSTAAASTIRRDRMLFFALLIDAGGDATAGDVGVSSSIASAP